MSRVNGEIRQSSNSWNMIFGMYRLMMTLDPGDVIATGTPSGVGIFYKPAPKLLNVEDLVEVEIEKIGVLANVVGGEP
ncbi:MAG: fumarylacetoacetate hydrolase family protein [Candidatus Caldarchaeum sp.]